MSIRKIYQRPRILRGWTTLERMILEDLIKHSELISQELNATTSLYYLQNFPQFLGEFKQKNYSNNIETHCQHLSSNLFALPFPEIVRVTILEEKPKLISKHKRAQYLTPEEE